MGAFPLDVKCVILGRNMRHIGVQSAAYYPAICGILDTNMPQIASKEIICKAATGHFRLPEAAFSVFPACRMPKKVDGVL